MHDDQIAIREIMGEVGISFDLLQSILTDDFDCGLSQQIRPEFSHDKKENVCSLRVTSGIC